MVGYYKLLSTVLSRGNNSGYTLVIKGLPHMVDWDFTVNEYTTARYACPPKRTWCSTWDTDSDIFGIKVRNVRTNIRAHGAAYLTDNNHSLYFYKHKKKLCVSVHLGSINVFEPLQYRLAAIGFMWRVLAYETKIPLGTLTLLIGDAWTLKEDAVSIKQFLVQKVPAKQEITIRKPVGLDEEDSLLVSRYLIEKRDENKE